MRQVKIFASALAVSAVIAIQGVKANEESEQNLVPVVCSGNDLLINNEFCIQSVANVEADYMIASASTLLPHPDTELFPNHKVVATLCDGQKMIQAFRFTYDEDQGENSSLFTLFTRYWIGDSIAFMNHFAVGIVRNAGGDGEDSEWAQTLSFETFEVEDSENLEIWPMNRMKRTFEEYQSFMCYNPGNYGYYPDAGTRVRYYRSFDQFE